VFDRTLLRSHSENGVDAGERGQRVRAWRLATTTRVQRPEGGGIFGAWRGDAWPPARVPGWVPGPRRRLSFLGEGGGKSRARRDSCLSGGVAGARARARGVALALARRPRAPVPAVHGLRGDVEGLHRDSGGDGVPFPRLSRSVSSSSSSLSLAVPPRSVVMPGCLRVRAAALPLPTRPAVRRAQCSHESRGAQPLPRLAGSSEFALCTETAAGFFELPPLPPRQRAPALACLRSNAQARAWGPHAGKDNPSSLCRCLRGPSYPFLSLAVSHSSPPELLRCGCLQSVENIL
jgi:hypothetical protein